MAGMQTEWGLGFTQLCTSPEPWGPRPYSHPHPPAHHPPTLPPPQPAFARPLQVYVGDFVKISTDENTKGWSIAQIEELYQTPSVRRRQRGCPGPSRRSVLGRRVGKWAAFRLPPERRACRKCAGQQAAKHALASCQACPHRHVPETVPW